MTELNLFPADLDMSTKALFFNMGENESLFTLTCMKELRKNGIACEVFHEPQKIDKQFRYAERKKIPYVVIIGSREMEEKSCVVKTLKSGEQITIPVSSLVNFFNQS